MYICTKRKLIFTTVVINFLAREPNKEDEMFAGHIIDNTCILHSRIITIFFRKQCQLGR
jgi:hypothetical protein